MLTFLYFSLTSLNLRFLPQFLLPGVGDVVPTSGFFIRGRQRPIKLSNAGKNVSPAIMHVAMPTDITQPKL
jgi:hypothetical protein